MSMIAQRRRTNRPKEMYEASCQVCAFPTTDRHHLLPVKDFTEPTEGAEDWVAYLCPNCHRLYHAIEQAHQSLTSANTVNRCARFAQSGGMSRHILPELCALVVKARRLQLEVIQSDIGLGIVDSSQMPRMQELRSDALASISACQRMLSNMEDAGMSRMSPLAMLIGGAT